LVHWPLMGRLLHLVQQGGAWAGWGPAQSHPCCTKCNSPPINGQCTNFILFDVALQLFLDSKGLNPNRVSFRLLDNNHKMLAVETAQNVVVTVDWCMLVFSFSFIMFVYNE